MNWTKEGDEAKKTSIYFNKSYMRRGKEEGKRTGIATSQRLNRLIAYSITPA